MNNKIIRLVPKQPTKGQLSLIEDALCIEAEEAKEAGAIRYMARVLTQATLPHSDPKVRMFERSNGNLTVTLADFSGRGLPFGSLPRLILSWVVTEAVRTKEKKILLGDTLTSFMNDLGLDVTGGTHGSITRLKEQMARLFACTIGYRVDNDNSMGLKKTDITKDMELWWDPKNADQLSLFQSYVELTDEFFNEVTDRPVPIDMRALAALKRSPLALDIYCWLTYRMSYLSKPVAVSWDQLQWQFGSNYASGKAGQEGFRAKFKERLKAVLVVYPDADVKPIRGRLLLSPSRTHVRR